MTSTLLVLLLSQAEGPAPAPATGAMPPPLPASAAGGGHYLTRLEATWLALLPGGEGHALKLGSDTAPVGPRLYALAEGGPLLLPEAEGEVRPGASASLGLGVDNEG